MRLKIVHRGNLDPGQIADLSQSAKDASAVDPGPCQVWDNSPYADKLYAIVLHSTNQPIGIFYVAGPNNMIDVAWWIKFDFRGQRYGSEAVDSLAIMLKAKGVTGIGHILISDEIHNRSMSLVRRLRAHFD